MREFSSTTPGPEPETVDFNRHALILDRWTQFSKQPPASTCPVDALITGASGFIGLNLAQRLQAQGKRVRLATRRPASLEPFVRAGAELQDCPLHDIAALAKLARGVRVVYHLAARTSAFSSEELLRVNGEGTRNLARACAEQENPPTFVLVSSVAAGGPAQPGKLRTERDLPEPISNYGRSKLAGELALLEFAHRMPCVIIRPGIVFGPHNREMLPIFQTIRRLGIHPVVGWGNSPLSYSPVNDTLEILELAAQHGSRLPGHLPLESHALAQGAGVYYAVDSATPSYAELGRLIGEQLGQSRLLVLPLLGPIAWLAAGVNELLSRLRGQSDSLNWDKIREASAGSWACSGEKAREELGFRPSATFEAQLRETVAWYERNQWL